jgi:hypothetical protein
MAFTKTMLAVLWNPHGSHTVTVLPRANRSMHRGSWIKTWSFWFKVSFHLAGVQGKKIDGSC